MSEERDAVRKLERKEFKSIIKDISEYMERPIEDRARVSRLNEELLRISMILRERSEEYSKEIADLEDVIARLSERDDFRKLVNKQTLKSEQKQRLERELVAVDDDLNNIKEQITQWFEYSGVYEAKRRIMKIERVSEKSRFMEFNVLDMIQQNLDKLGVRKARAPDSP